MVTSSNWTLKHNTIDSTVKHWSDTIPSTTLLWPKLLMTSYFIPPTIMQLTALKNVAMKALTKWQSTDTETNTESFLSNYKIRCHITTVVWQNKVSGVIAYTLQANLAPLLLFHQSFPDYEHVTCTPAILLVKHVLFLAASVHVRRVSVCLYKNWQLTTDQKWK